MRTNFMMIKDLMNTFEPKRRGVITGDEVEAVKMGLCLDEMDNLALCNLRDFVVLYIANLIEEHENRYEETGDRDDYKAIRKYSDIMSAICCVIDNEKFGRGLEV